MITWTMLATGVCGVPRTQSVAAWFAGKLWVIGGRDAAAKPLYAVWSSADGVSWTQTKAPNWLGLPSPVPQVLNNKLCLFMAPYLLGGTAGPLAMWRMDALGNWTQDAPIPNVKTVTGNTPLGGIPIATYQDTLFAYFGNHTDQYGIWMTNT